MDKLLKNYYGWGNYPLLTHTHLAVSYATGLKKVKLLLLHFMTSGITRIFAVVCVCGGGGGDLALSWGHKFSFVHLFHIKHDVIVGGHLGAHAPPAPPP